MLENTKEVAERLKKARQCQLDELFLTIQIFKNRKEKQEDEQENAKLDIRIKQAESLIPQLETEISEFKEIIEKA
jgi:hypothetical protein